MRSAHAPHYYSHHWQEGLLSHSNRCKTLSLIWPREHGSTSFLPPLDSIAWAPRSWDSLANQFQQACVRLLWTDNLLCKSHTKSASSNMIGRPPTLSHSPLSSWITWDSQRGRSRFHRDTCITVSGESRDSTRNNIYTWWFHEFRAQPRFWLWCNNLG